MAFSYRGKLWWSKHVGRLNYNDTNSPPPDNDTPYPVASITKVFTVGYLNCYFLGTNWAVGCILNLESTTLQGRLFIKLPDQKYPTTFRNIKDTVSAEMQILGMGVRAPRDSWFLSPAVVDVFS